MPDLANGKYVSQADADRQWCPSARDVLIDVAGEYGAWITNSDLADRIQARAGITTRQPASEWIGRVLGKVADDAQQRGEPRLTSLCVTSERLVVHGYPGAPSGADVRTRERVAAEDRLECYRFFGAKMPDAGGTPTLLTRLSERPARPTRNRASAHPPAPAPAAAMRETTCSDCFMVVPVAATCRDCGGSLAA